MEDNRADCDLKKLAETQNVSEFYEIVKTVDVVVNDRSFRIEVLEQVKELPGRPYRVRCYELVHFDELRHNHEGVGLWVHDIALDQMNAKFGRDSIEQVLACVLSDIAENRKPL